MNNFKKQAILLAILFSFPVARLCYAQEAPAAMMDVLDLKAMEVADVLKLISLKGGFNILSTPNVKGKVSAYLKGVEPEAALRMIVEANGWAYEREGDLVKVVTEAEFENKHGHKFGQEFHTRIYSLKHCNTSQLLPVLNELKSNAGKVISDPQSNTLILKDEQENIDRMADVIARIDVPVATQVFDVHYAQMGHLSPMIEQMLTPLSGSVKTDERSGKIIITDTEEKIARVASLIKAFDEKQKEVLIESKIVRVVLSDEQKLGIDWEALIDDFHGMNLHNNFDILSPADKSGRLSIGTVSRDKYTAMIEALETIGTTEILASPSIAVVNNKEARIHVGSQEPYVTTTTTTPASGPTIVSEAVSFIEVGVKLFATPTIHDDGYITMHIKPEVSTVTGNIVTSNNNTIPIIETSLAETTVTVKDQVTIVIGGLIKEDNIKTVKQVPVLGSIPVVGNAFKNKSDMSRKTEIVIFLTPKLINGDVAMNDN